MNHAYGAALDEVAVNPRTRLLDVTRSADGALIAHCCVPGIDLLHPALVELPFTSEAFDVVTTVDANWTVNRASLHAIRRVLAAGGRLVLRAHEPAAVEALLRDAGFTPRSQSTSPYVIADV